MQTRWSLQARLLALGWRVSIFCSSPNQGGEGHINLWHYLDFLLLLLERWLLESLKEYSKMLPIKTLQIMKKRSPLFFKISQILWKTSEKTLSHFIQSLGAVSDTLWCSLNSISCRLSFLWHTQQKFHKLLFCFLRKQFSWEFFQVFLVGSSGIN